MIIRADTGKTRDTTGLAALSAGRGLNGTIAHCAASVLKAIHSRRREKLRVGKCTACGDALGPNCVRNTLQWRDRARLAKRNFALLPSSRNLRPVFSAGFDVHLQIAG